MRAAQSISRNAKTEFAGYKSLAALFVTQAKRYQTKVLYRFWHAGQWQSLTWNDALIQVKEIALGLVSLGVSRGDRIAILAGNCVEWLLVDWANICIGALSVPIYASSSGSQAVHIIGHSDPAVLIVDSMRRLEKLDFARTTLSGFKATVHFAEEKVEGDQRLPGKTLSIENLREMGRAYETCHPGVFELFVQSLLPQDDLTIIYTSGTTGVPKGVLSTHANYLFMIQAVDAAVPSTDRDVAMHFLPTAHSFGRLEHFMAVAKGWTLGVARSIETIPSDLRAIRPSVLFCVPRIYESAHSRIRHRLKSASPWRRKMYEWGLTRGKLRVESHQQNRSSNWRSSLGINLVNRWLFARVRAAFGGRLRVAISGSAPLPVELALYFRAIGIPILEGYGLTETSTVSHVNRADNFKLGTVGLPLPGTECRIAADGEIQLRGPHIFKSYFRDLLATEEAIDAEGYFHTGDIGAIDAGGFLSVTDRKRDLIVTSGGKKVAPQKIENLLKTDPMVNQVLVVGRGQPHLLALITLDRKRVEKLAKENGIMIDVSANLAAHPWVHGQVREIIQRANKQLAPFEAVRNFSILDHDFTIEGEELTPTLKPRRQIIEEHHKDLIQNLYRKGS